VAPVLFGMVDENHHGRRPGFGLGGVIEFEEERNRVKDIDTYYNHTQSGINRTAARQERSNILVKVIKGVALL